MMIGVLYDVTNFILNLVCTLSHVTTSEGVTTRETSVMQSASLLAAAALLLCARLVHCQVDPPPGTLCDAVDGKPSCVCAHPDGTLDLTSIASSDGTARSVCAAFAKALSNVMFC